MPTVNIKLKTALLEAGLTAREIAQETEIHETRLSRIVRGHLRANATERRRIARALRRQEADLFPDTQAVA